MFKFKILFFSLLLFSLCSFAQHDSTLKFPVVLNTFQTICNHNPEKYNDSSLFVLFVRSLDSVFNFEQKIFTNTSCLKVELYDSTIDFKEGLKKLPKRRTGLRKVPEKSDEVIESEIRYYNYQMNMRHLNRYCNVVEPKIKYVLSKYKVNIGADYFLSNFLVSLTCPNCWVFTDADAKSFWSDECDPDLDFSKMYGTETVITRDVVVADSLEIKAGAKVISVEGVPAKLLPYGLLAKIMVSRRDTTTSFVVEQDHKLLKFSYHFRKDTVQGFGYRILKDSIAFIKVNTLWEGTTDQISKRLVADSAQIKSIILDFRQCPGGLVTESIALADVFLDKGCLIGEQKGSRFEIFKTYNDNKTYYSSSGNVLSNTPIFIITDTTTAGGAQITVAALQNCKRALVIGQGTAGDGMIRQTHYLPMVQQYYISVNTLDFKLVGKYDLGNYHVTPDKYYPLKDNESLLNAAIEMCRKHNN